MGITKLSITIHGLCLVATRGQKQADVLCHPEGGAHKPMLVVRVKELRLAEVTWNPSYVGHDASGEEIGIWDLRGITGSFGIPADLKFLPGANAVRLSERHKGNAKPKDDTEARKVIFPGNGAPEGSIISLHGGTLVYAAAPTVKVKVTQGGVEGQPEVVSTAIRWEGTFDETNQPKNSKNEILALQTGSALSIHLTNVSTVVAPDGLGHFKFYYSLVTGVAASEELELNPSGLDTNVYDCVPPTEVP